MRVEFLKELLEDEKFQQMTVANFVKTIKKSGIWDFDPQEDKVTANINALPQADTPLGSNPFMEG